MLLTKCPAPLEHIIDRLVQAVGRQSRVRTGGKVGLDGARHGDHDAHVEGLQFHAQSARPDFDGALGGGVDCAEEVRDLRGAGGDVDDEAAGGDEEGDEGVDYAHGAEDVSVICSLDVVHVGIYGRDDVRTTTDHISQESLRTDCDGDGDDESVIRTHC